MTSKIFISYRREEFGHAGRLYDALKGTFDAGQLFMDVDSIPPGSDFKKIIEQQVQQSDAVLAVMGSRWLHAVDESGARRLDNPKDFVRIELESAFDLQKIVIPVLMGEVRMPLGNQLPDRMKALVERQAVRLSSERFQSDAEQFITSLSHTVRPARSLKRYMTNYMWSFFAILIALIMGGILVSMALRENSVSTSGAKSPIIQTGPGGKSNVTIK